MIVRHLDDGRTLIDREAASVLFGRSTSTIRAKCKPIASDRSSRRALYDAEHIRAMNDVVVRNLATIDPKKLANLRNMLTRRAS